jgi:ABC-type glycerol-3-phosphate transport system substrate-binding protein
MKKVLLGLFAVLLSLAVVASNPAVFAKAKGPVTISFWFPGADKVNNTYFLDAVKEFEKTHRQIKVNVTILPSTQADVDLKLNAAVLGGIYPDVLSAFLSTMATRSPQGEFAPLDKYIRAWSDKNDIFKSVYDIGKINNKTMGLGYYPNPEILVYRKDYFKEAGLDPNHPPANWEELAAAAKKLTVRDNKNNVTRAGLDIPALNAQVFFKPFCRQNGAAVIDNKRKRPLFTDPKMIAAFEYLIKLKNENVSIPFNYQKKDSIPFQYGRSAMSFMQPTQIVSLFMADPAMKEKIGLAPVLTGNKKSDFCGYRLFTIGAASKHKNEAWEFIRFMMSKEQMCERYKTLKIPPVRSSMENDFVALDPAFNKVVMDYVKHGEGDNTVPWNTLATKYLHQAWEEAYNGKKTSAQALKDAQTGLLKELKSMK